VFTRNCAKGKLSALIQCWNIVHQIERDGFQCCQTWVPIYMTLKSLTLQRTPYVYDISRLRVNIEFCGAYSHFCHAAYITWSHVELWSTYMPARLSNFCSRTHLVRCDQYVDIVTSCFQKWRKCLLKKCVNGPFYITQSVQIVEISIWEPTHGTG
jgi:hypothetical protein